MLQGWRILGIAAMAAAAGFVAPGQAEACACGGFASQDSRLTAVRESALVEVEALAPGRTFETVTLNLDLHADGRVTDAAFVMPVPGPAQFALADERLFDKLDQVTAPAYEEEVRYRPLRLFPDFGPAREAVSAGATSAARSAVEVTGRIVLGPYAVVTLTGADATEVRMWLGQNGYRLSRELDEGLGEYLAKGWQIVAVKLSSDAGLQGSLPPMRIAFASDEVVYPMRLSAHAKHSAPLQIYVLADHRAEISNPDPGYGPPRQFFAGWVAPQDLAPALAVSGKRYLTRYDQMFYPVAGAADVVVTAASDDTPYRTVYRTVVWRDSPWQTPLRAAMCLGVPVLVALGALLVGRRSAKR